MRGGQVLVRSLDFADDAEEYEYYVTKTRSQLDAIGMLKNNSGRSSKLPMIDRLLADSQSLIDQAAKLASTDDHKRAIPLMEKALGRLQSGLMMVVSKP